jgi:WD40 repeat protein
VVGLTPDPAITPGSGPAPDGAVALGRRGFVVWNGSEARIVGLDLSPVAVLAGLTHPLTRVVVKSDGLELWTVDGGSLVRFDARTGARLASAPAPAEVTGLALSADGSRLAVGGGGGQVIIYEASQLRSTAGIDQPLQAGIRDLSFTRDGHELAFLAGAEPRVWVIGRPTSRTIGRDRAGGLAISPDGTLVALWGDGSVPRIVRLADGLRVADLEGHRGVVLDAVWDPRPDASIIYTAGADGRVFGWEAATGRPLVSFTLGRPILRLQHLAGGLLAQGDNGAVWRLVVGDERRAPLEVSGRVGARAGWLLQGARLLRRR